MVCTPLDDQRVRQAMLLAINRYEMAKVIGPLTGLKTVGGLMHPDTPWALFPEELQALPGLGRDYKANLKEAKRLLAEAGYPDGFKTELLNRAVKLPYIDYGVYLITAWTRIEVRSARIRNYEPHHSHHMNRRMEDVWLAKQ